MIVSSDRKNEPPTETSPANAVTGEYVCLDGEQYYRIANHHLMPDFFMSLVGASDHWMFVSSNGALTAGRRNPDTALFPYGSDDQISSARAGAGPITLIRFQDDTVWQPFAPHDAGTEEFRRNIYKTALGNKLVFEEINEVRELAFRYRWTFSERFGFVRSCCLTDLSSQPRSIELLDGLQNVLPYGVDSEFLMRFSNLANAYKKSELIADSSLGLYYLSSIPTDRAEPSEGLKATTVWQTGLTPNATLLSSEQITAFRAGQPLQTEADIRGRAGAYLLNQAFDLGPNESKQWHIVSELSQDHCDVIALSDWIQKTASPLDEVAKDVEKNEQDFLRIISSSDGVQCSNNTRRANRHLSNTVFNMMRGGVPVDHYQVQTADFAKHIANFNSSAFDRHRSFIEALPETLSIDELRSAVAKLEDPDLTRLCMEYLPLAFSRRHGDPTRPWNRFSIDLRSDDGSTNLNYQGNWRDIFQNWEALLLSFPNFATSMISRFVNSTTADGYNPYRVTKDGFEWEEPTPDDPWANIGYWGDHQIIYLLKLMEWNQSFHPGSLDALLNTRQFTHANVPYRIKSFDQIKLNAQDTIDFDANLAEVIRERVANMGADGKLLPNQHGEIHYVTLMEKILTLSLAKLSNFIPDGGIWLNTQRPEWNDANNALVGNGLSMVTTCYLYRWFSELSDWLSNAPDNSNDSFSVSTEVAAFFESITKTLQQHETALDKTPDDKTRSNIVEALSQAGSEFRTSLYATGLGGETTELSRGQCLALFATAKRHLATTIRRNRRPDGLFHAYNLIYWNEQGVSVEHLYEMLEGQVAVLSAGLLEANEVAELLDALRSSTLYRANQDSYVLYPDRQLPRFLKKNQIAETAVASNPLIQKLLAAGHERIVKRDIHGGVHFNGQFRNSNDLRAAIDKLGADYESEIRDGGEELAQTFEEIFDHRQFTGRSGTFFAYEGLGSIYWHMVSKLALAVSENTSSAIEAGESQATVDQLKAHLEAIRQGIGAEKPPTEYGAFPSDPYSHTPENAGVKQPGMTGQVKEDVLARFAEIGVRISGGCLSFQLDLFDRNELLDEAAELSFYDLKGKQKTISVAKGAFAFTLCQVPIVYETAESDSVDVELTSGETLHFDGLQIDRETSQLLFSRTGDIVRIQVRARSDSE